MNYLDAWIEDARAQREREARAYEALLEELLEGEGIEPADLDDRPPLLGPRTGVEAA